MQYLAIPDKGGAKKEGEDPNNDPADLSQAEDNEEHDVTANRGDASDRESVYSKNSKAISKAGGDDDDDGEESGEDDQDDKPSLQVRGIAKNRDRRATTLQNRVQTTRDNNNQ